MDAGGTRGFQSAAGDVFRYGDHFVHALRYGSLTHALLPRVISLQNAALKKEVDPLSRSIDTFQKMLQVMQSGENKLKKSGFGTEKIYNSDVVSFVSFKVALLKH